MGVSEVLLLLWSSPVSPRFEVIDLFSGVGAVAARYRASGRPAAEYDFIHHENAMNFLSCGGYA